MSITHRKSIIIVSLSVVVAIGVGVVISFFLIQKNNGLDSKQEASSGVIKTAASIENDSDNLTPAQLNARYDEKAFDIAKEISVSDPKKWTKNDLDKVYFLLTYYEKIDNNVSAYTLLAQLETAQSSGINLDDNSFGRDEVYRKDLRERVIQDTQVKRMMGLDA